MRYHLKKEGKNVCHQFPVEKCIPELKSRDQTTNCCQTTVSVWNFSGIRFIICEIAHEKYWRCKKANKVSICSSLLVNVWDTASGDDGIGVTASSIFLLSRPSHRANNQGQTVGAEWYHSSIAMASFKWGSFTMATNSVLTVPWNMRMQKTLLYLSERAYLKGVSIYIALKFAGRKH